MVRNEDGFPRLVVLFLMGFSLALSSVALEVPTRSLKPTKEAYQSIEEFLAQDAMDLSGRSQLLDAREGYRKVPASLDPRHHPPGTAANPRHYPETPPGAY